MFCYRQTTGEFFLVCESNGNSDFKMHPIGDTGMQGELIGTGYAGRNVMANGVIAFRGRNETQLESLSNIGPLPRGGYEIQRAENHPLLGVCAMPLLPDSDNTMFGRGDFWIHGDNATHDASHGCIAMDRVSRIMISTEVIKGNCHLLVIS